MRAPSSQHERHCLLPTIDIHQSGCHHMLLLRLCLQYNFQVFLTPCTLARRDLESSPSTPLDAPFLTSLAPSALSIEHCVTLREQTVPATCRTPGLHCGNFCGRCRTLQLPKPAWQTPPIRR